MIYDNILGCLGNTPVLRLNKIVDNTCAEILVKFEGLNVGASIKTRTAYAMINKAEQEGKINPKYSIIVEPTSGNQGIGLALVAAVKGYKAILIMPDSVSEERRKLIKHYGAKLELIHDEGNIGECIKKCVELANKLASKNKNVFIPQQFKNIENLNAHRTGTAKEILEQIKVPIHGFCCGIGTGGTITAVGETLKEVYPDISIWAVEPEKAAILSGKEIKTHIQMGIGDGIIPEILNTNVYDEVCIISDDEAVDTAKKLAKSEGIMCGISSGTNVAAALKLAKKLGKGKTVLTILPDTAERYFSTALFE